MKKMMINHPDKSTMDRIQRGIIHVLPFIATNCSHLLKKFLDHALKNYEFYRQVMDDWVIRVKSKHQLWKVIKLTYKILNSLKLNIHPKKNFLGCIIKGFDILVVQFSDTPKISKINLENHHAKIAQLYAQGARDACIDEDTARWSSWSAGMLKHCKLTKSSNPMPSERIRRSGCMEPILEFSHEPIFESIL